jgi:surface antigen
MRSRFAAIGFATVAALHGWAPVARAVDAPTYQVNPNAVGNVIGGVLAHRVARRLDDEDRRIAAQAEYKALEFGRPGTATNWENPSTQHRGVIVPEQPYPRGDQYCRLYTHTIDLGGAGETIKEIACRKPDGTWLSEGNSGLFPRKLLSPMP